MRVRLGTEYHLTTGALEYDEDDPEHEMEIIDDQEGFVHR